MQFDKDTVYGRLANALYKQELTVAEIQLPPAPAEPQLLLQDMAAALEGQSALHPGRAWGLAMVMELVAQQTDSPYWVGLAAVYQSWAANLWVKLELAEEAADKAAEWFMEYNLPQWHSVTIWLKNAQPWMGNPQEALKLLKPLQHRWPQDETGRRWFHHYLFSLAWTHVMCRQMDEALETVAKAEAQCQTLNDSIGLARVPFLLGAICRNQGRYNEAIDYYGQAAEQMTNTAGAAFAARILCGYGHALRQGSTRFVDALKAFGQSAALAEAADIPYWQGMALNGQIAINRYQGRFSQANELARQARQIFTSQQVITGLIESLIDSSAIQYELGQFQTALRYVQEGLLLQREHSTYNLYELILQMNEGILEWQLGHYQTALKQLEAVRRNAKQTSYGPLIAEVNLYLAHVWYDLAEFQKGSDAYEAARATVAQIDNIYLQYNLMALENGLRLKTDLNQSLVDDLEHQINIMTDKRSLLYTARLTQLRAVVMIKLGQLEEASDLLPRCLADFQEMEMVGAQAETYMWLGHILKQQQDMERAAEAWQNALNLSTQQPQTRWQVHMELARLLGQDDTETQTIIHHYEQALSALASIRQMVSQPALLSAVLLDAEQAVSEALQFSSQLTAEKALVLLEMSKAHTLAVKLRQKVLVKSQGQSAEAQVVRHELFALQQDIARESSRIARIRRQYDWFELIQKYDQLQAEFERSQQTLPSPAVPAAYFQLTQFREKMTQYWGDHWLALDYFWHEDVLLIFAVSPDAVWVERPEIKTLPVLLTLLDDPAMIQPAHLRALAEMLLPQSITTRLNLDDVLLIAPYGRLHNLPWGALRVNTLDDRPLVACCQPLIIPALHLFTALDGDTTKLDTGLITAVAEFPERDYNPLPYTRTEAEQLQQLLGWPIYQQDQATWQALQTLWHDEQWEKIDCWHLATHAFFAEQVNARACGMALYDQDIWLDDLALLAPLPALITLSTCSGLPSKLFPGDDHAGLAATCLAAGSKNVVGSLWRMRDDLSQEIFVSFYQSMQAGASPLTALVQIQRQMIKANRPLTEWGGLRISGRGL